MRLPGSCSRKESSVTRSCFNAISSQQNNSVRLSPRAYSISSLGFSAVNGARDRFHFMGQAFGLNIKRLVTPLTFLPPLHHGTDLSSSAVIMPCRVHSGMRLMITFLLGKPAQRHPGL